MAQVPPIDSGAGDHVETEPRVEHSPSLSKSDRFGHRSDQVLPSLTSDEQDLGWGDEPSDYSDDWYRSERPPHHDH